MTFAPFRAEVVGSLLRPRRLSSTGACADPFEMLADAAAVVRAEIADLRALGCECVQIDAPELATLVDPAIRVSFAQRGVDPERMLGEGIEILDSVVVTPQCGFESAIGSHPLDAGQQERRLRLVVDVAEPGWAA